MTAGQGPVSPVLVCGEVRTCLLPSSRALDGPASARLLRLRADEHVLISERPNLYVRSPEVLTGVDCRLPTSNGAKVRAVGAVTSRAVLTEGRVLQASAYFSSPAAGPGTRRPWGEYLVRPGVVEPVGQLPGEPTAKGILRGPGRGELNLGMIADGLLEELRCHPLLDHRVPFKSPLTHVRWVVRHTSEQKDVLERFTLVGEGLRTVELRLADGIPGAAAASLCEDLALHDWLLTTATHVVGRSSRRAAAGPRGAMGELRAAAEHLLHLWMPRARVDPPLTHLWDPLEQTPGFTRQWQNLAQRIRDRLSLQDPP
ncbi:SCO2521 family protein [Streptomyces massasporeus]